MNTIHLFNQRVPTKGESTMTNVRHFPKVKVSAAPTPVFSSVRLQGVIHDIVHKLQELHKRDPAPFRINKKFTPRAAITKITSAASRYSVLIFEHTDTRNIIEVMYRETTFHCVENIGRRTAITQRTKYDTYSSVDVSNLENDLIVYMELSQVVLPHIQTKVKARRWPFKPDEKTVVSRVISGVNTLATGKVELSFVDRADKFVATFENINESSDTNNLMNSFFVLNHKGKFGIYSPRTYRDLFTEI